MIDKVIGNSSVKPIATTPKAGRVDIGEQFNSILNDALAKIGGHQQEVDQLNNMFAAGELPDVHKLLIAAEKSSLNLQLTVQVRNKVIEAYQEIMRTQI
ncbi:MAG: flagellar hook-basal body complex protein FliE [Paenibacillaceae bacterium]